MTIASSFPFPHGLRRTPRRFLVRRPPSQTRQDPATGLPNACALLAGLDRLARGSARDDSYLLGVVTIYNSDEMSSAYGHGVMDDSMQMLAACAARHLPADAQVCRIGTDQIGFLVATREAEIPGVLARVNAAFRQPLLHQGEPIHADTRIGYVPVTGFHEDPESYLRKAQAASLRASQSGRDIAPYTEGIRTQARDNLVMLGELIGGMERREVQLHYQPKVALASGRLVGAEALIRWEHPRRGHIAPGVFVPRAEQSTLIHALTEFALATAMRQAACWRAAGRPVPIAVNVSPRNLMQPGFAQQVLRIVAECGVSPGLLELEVTEGAMAGDLEQVAAELHQLANHGVKIAIDDFGTGYSSLSYLDQLPVSTIKIDQSFIRRLYDEPSTLDIVDAVVSVAHKKGASIVAEGVETVSAYETLRALGCDVAQGYVIGRPMPAAEFEHWAAGWQCFPPRN